LALKEVPVANGIAAMGAAKVLGMPHPAQRNHHWSDDGLSALGAVAFRDCVNTQFVALQHGVAAAILGLL
jgi:hypothetical protein